MIFYVRNEKNQLDSFFYEEVLEDVPAAENRIMKCGVK